jgi:lipopolysaccharide export system protein LptA
MHTKFLCVLILMSSATLCHAQILNHLSKSKDDSPIIIEADGSVVCDEMANKCVATGNASAQKNTNTIYGDVLTVYFTDGDEREVTSMTADGHVRMETPTEKAFGEHAQYDVKLDRLLMTGGNLRIVTPKETITAKDSLEYWHAENKGIARGNAIAAFPAKEELIQADTLVAYFNSSADKTQTKNENEQNNEKTGIDRVEAEGNILASGPKGVVTGDRGTYTAISHIVEVFNNVKLTQGKNVIEGGYARHNLKTNVAEMFTEPPHVSSAGPIKRISGIIMPSDAKKMKTTQAE